MTDAMEGKSEQTREIESVLDAAKDKPAPTAPAEEWNAWEDSIQASVDKLLTDSRTFKLGLLAVGAVAGLALGVGAMSMKAAQQLMQGLNAVAFNQQNMAQAMGMVPTEANMPVAQPKPSKTTDNTEVNKEPVVDAKTFDVPDDSAVAEPFDTPATEASQAAKEQMAKDKADGLIDYSKDGGDDLQ